MYPTGCVSGKTGPAIFLLQGQHQRPIYSKDLLVHFGCRKVSTIITTPKASMISESWLQMTPHICYGLRKINLFVKANPHWYMLGIFDGFGAHMSSVLALKMRLSFRILSLNEEGDTSHVNQAYSKFVAKRNKISQSYSIGVQPDCKYYNSGVVDQWGLIYSGMMAVHKVIKSAWTK